MHNVVMTIMTMKLIFWKV